ncbi:MAG: phenylalanine--tRNA ligase subunit beta [Mycoplasmatota bacterium]
MISLNWVKEYLDLDNIDLQELAVDITKAGVNVEKVVSNNIKNLVIGHVLTTEKHPDSDHLNVCSVDLGDEITTIVCGASNVRADLKVIVAKVGACLPGDFVIKKSKIRGVESNGMICALYELGLEEKTEERYNAGICELSKDAPVGSDPISYLGLDDTLYELDVHKHRNNDCYYHIGFAYEIGTIINQKVKLPKFEISCIKENINDYFKLDVKTDKCPYYLAKMVKNIKIGPSPDFIKKRLESVGMRSINNVVDISNYVMLEYGQPLHFFDFDKLGNKITVREANDETIVTLDNQERKLTNDIVISSDKPVAIAGVMGGENTQVDETTTSLLIESAIFDSFSIRNTANRLNLRSEASIRYGKGLNFEYTDEAILRACYLLNKYASADILDGMVKHDKIDKTNKTVTFTTEEVNKMLGITISTEDMLKQLDRLDFEYDVKDEIIVTIPNRRLDIESNINDIAEEIGRLYGYHNLKSTQPSLEVKKGVYIGDVYYRKQASKRLRALGLNEVKTYTLTSVEDSNLFKYDNLENMILPNPMSKDKSVIRTSLLPSLLNVYKYNKARKVEDVLIYEISKTYDINFSETSKIAILMKGNYLVNNVQGSKEVDFYTIKGIVENILDYFGFKNRYSFKKDSINDLHPGISASIIMDRKKIGVIGKVHPKLIKDNIYVAEISLNELMKTIKPIKFKEANKFPSISKDLAFIVKKDVASETIEATIRKSGGRLLESINAFDVYTGDKVGEDEKSIAYALTFTDSTKTLNEIEVMEVFNKIIDSVTKNNNAVLRDK